MWSQREGAIELSYPFSFKADGGNYFGNKKNRINYLQSRNVSFRIIKPNRKHNLKYYRKGSTIQ